MKSLLIIVSKFYYLNPRWLYLLVTLVLLIPLIFHVPMPQNTPSQCSIGLYETVGECPSDKVILIDSSWDLGSKPECMSVLEAFATDLCKRGYKFIVIGTSPYAPTFAMEIITPIAEKAEYVYGKDWVHLGYLQPPANNFEMLVDSFCRDIHDTRPVDINNTPVGDIPLMKNVKTSDDIHMVFAINYCPPEAWFSIGKAQFGLLTGFGSAAMMATYYQVFFDSEQLCGLLTGNLGAYQYETLTNEPGMGTKVMMSFAFGHCFIIFAVLFGNIGFWAAKKLRRM